METGDVTEDPRTGRNIGDAGTIADTVEVCCIGGVVLLKVLQATCGSRAKHTGIHRTIHYCCYLHDNYD